MRFFISPYQAQRCIQNTCLQLAHFKDNCSCQQIAHYDVTCTIFRQQALCNTLNCQKLWWQELSSWQNAKSRTNYYPARDKWPLAKRKGIFFHHVFFFAGSHNFSAKSSTTNHYVTTVRTTTFSNITINDQKMTSSYNHKVGNDKRKDAYCTYSSATQQKQTNDCLEKEDSFFSQRTWAVPTYHIPFTKARAHWLPLALYKARSNKADDRANRRAKLTERIYEFSLYSNFHTLLLSHQIVFSVNFSISKSSTNFITVSL